jgi:hypothetical protein
MVHDILNVDGSKMEKDLSSIMTSAERDQDIYAAYHAGRALRNLLLGRLYVVKFLNTNSPKDAARVEAEFTKLEEELATLGTHLENPERKKLLSRVDKNDHEYHMTFQKLTELIYARIGIGRRLTAPPSLTTQHTGPYCAVRLIRQDQIQGNKIDLVLVSTPYLLVSENTSTRSSTSQLRHT